MPTGVYKKFHVATQKFLNGTPRRLMKAVERLGRWARELMELGIDVRLPPQLLIPRLYFLAPRLAVKLADAS